jgi:hypothetical protein
MNLIMCVLMMIHFKFQLLKIQLGNLNSFHPIAQWDNVSPNAFMAHIKALNDDFIVSFGLRSFYKSYYNWSKMKRDQQDKAIGWFQKLQWCINATFF